MIPLFELFFNQYEFLIEPLVTRLQSIEAVFITEYVFDSHSLHGNGAAFSRLNKLVDIDVAATTAVRCLILLVATPNDATSCSEDRTLGPQTGINLRLRKH